MCWRSARSRSRRVWFFLFSSRRRHTRLQGDWSSDVCSSDLPRDGRPARMTSVAEFLARASVREEVRPADARAGAVYQRMVVDGEPYFVKRLSPASDWIMRVTGDRVHRPYLVWQAGIMGRVPDCIDPAVG